MYAHIHLHICTHNNVCTYTILFSQSYTNRLMVDITRIPSVVQCRCMYKYIHVMQKFLLMYTYRVQVHTRKQAQDRRHNTLGIVERRMVL